MIQAQVLAEALTRIVSWSLGPEQQRQQAPLPGPAHSLRRLQSEAQVQLPDLPRNELPLYQPNPEKNRYPSLKPKDLHSSSTML